MSTNDHPEVGVPSAGPGNDPAPAATTNEPHAPSSEPTEAANAVAQAQNPQQKPEDAKSADGGESAAPAPTTTNDTTVAPSTSAPQKTSEEPKEPASESSAAHAKEVEDPKKEQEEEEDEGEDTGPSLVITLLLTSGSRHPFKINGKYLRQQSINVENNDPFAMSVYTLKELIWRGWRPGKDASSLHATSGSLKCSGTNYLQIGKRVHRRLARFD